MFVLNDSEIEKIATAIMEQNEIYTNLSVQKYYTRERFLKSLKTNHFTFQKPATWEDPFEDFMSKLVNTHKDAIYNSFQITGNIYAMSTINKNNECDGMWNNFAKKKGILIHIKVKKLLKSIVKYLLNNGCCKDAEVYPNKFDVTIQLIDCIKISKIKYLKDEDIALRFRQQTKIRDNDFAKLSYEMLSIKRKEFEYENEYRFFINQELLKLEEVRFLPIGYLRESIDKIIISPMATTAEENELRNIFSEQYSIPTKIVEKSNLYNIEHFKDTYNL